MRLLTTIRGRLWLWATAMLLMVVGFAAFVVPHLRIDTDILTLLPVDQRDAGAEQALRTYTDQLGRRTLFLVEAADIDSAKKAARAFADALQKSGAFSRVQLELDAGIVSGLRDYLPYRYSLLSDADRTRLQQGQSQQLYDDALRSLYTPTSWMRPFSASEDPLGLLSGFVAGLRPPVGQAGPHDGVLAVVTPAYADVLVIAQTAGSPFSATVQESAGPAIASARNAGLAAGARSIVGSGVILHAAEAARHAKSEMGLFSAIALVGCALLLLVTFRSLRPMFFGTLAMGFGAIAGLAACYVAFGKVHMLTLVFGSSLIGTAVDYAVYYFADRFRDARATPEATVRNVTAGILLGYMTTAMSYLALLAAPFPGLRQIALFSAVGLGVACACMLCLFPLFRVAGSGPAPAIPGFARWLARQRWADASPTYRMVTATVVVVLLAGLLRISFLDDVRALQIPSPDLLKQELRVRQVLGQMPDSRFVLVRGDSAEQVLQREETLRNALDPLRSQGRLGGFFDLSSALPSLQRQQADRELLLKQVYAADGLMPRLMHQLGYSDDAIHQSCAAAAASDRLLTPEEFLRGPMAELYRTQWLGDLGHGYGSIVTLFDLSDVAALERATRGLPGISVIDKVGDISTILRTYRRLALALIAGVYVFIAMALCWRYGWRDGMLTLVPAIGAAVLAIAVQSWLGLPVNLFNVLALLLVLGMGVDYAIFLRESRSAMEAAILAVCVATLAAALSFGVLVLSTTPFIKSIGLTMAIGIVAASWLVVSLRPRAAAGQQLNSIHR